MKTKVPALCLSGCRLSEFGGKPVEYRVCKNLYVATRLYDSQPYKIISRLRHRDDNVDSDWFIFAVDP